jgi:hypothetical protein
MGESMTTERRLEKIEIKLDGQAGILLDIQKTLSKIAVQDEKIQHGEAQTVALWSKLDALTDPKDGAMTVISRHQASCPRSQIKFLWGTLISILVAAIALVAEMWP